MTAFAAASLGEGALQQPRGKTMWTKEGRIAVHKMCTMQETNADIFIGLLKTIDSTPDADQNFAGLGTHMVECNFPGYGQIANPSWTAPTINGSDQAEGQSSLLTWTASSGSPLPQTIVAVFVIIEMASGAHYLSWLKRISPTVTIGAPGEQYQIFIDLFADDISALD